MKVESEVINQDGIRMKIMKTIMILMTELKILLMNYQQLFTQVNNYILLPLTSHTIDLISSFGWEDEMFFQIL